MQSVVASGFVMPRDGKLVVSYSSLVSAGSYLTRFDTPLPSFASLITEFVSGDSVASDLLTPRFPNKITSEVQLNDLCDFSPYRGSVK